MKNYRITAHSKNSITENIATAAALSNSGGDNYIAITDFCGFCKVQKKIFPATYQDIKWDIKNNLFSIYEKDKLLIQIEEIEILNLPIPEKNMEKTD